MSSPRARRPGPRRWCARCSRTALRAISSPRVDLRRMRSASSSIRADTPSTRAVWQQHQVARGNAELRGQARALGADRILDHLHHDLPGHRAPVPRSAASATGGCRLLAFARFRRRARRCRGMQEGGALQADVHERGLHARHHPQHAALVDVADVAAPRSAFDVHLLQHAVLDHGHAGLARGDIDEYLFGHDRALPSLFARLRQRGRHVMTPNSRSSIAVSCRGKPITPE
jgi:hypothetical protein